MSGLTQYLGAAIAVGLFTVLPPGTLAWARVAVAAVVLTVWRRPWRTRWTRAELGASALFGVVLALMNVTFYIAIDSLPLGTAVAIEFIGPVAVAAVTGRGWRERGAIAVAALGVVLLAGVSLDAGPDAARGLVAIAVAAACWAGYILLGRRVAQHGGSGGGVTSLAVAMGFGALVLAPFLAGRAGPLLTDPRLAVLVVAIAVLSSVVPYALEQVVLRKVTSATFAVLLAMLPATAAVVGAVVLRQWPHGLEIVGLGCVTVAIILSSSRPAAPTADVTPG